MSVYEILKTIDILREKAELNKLVIFVGSGVSCNVPGMPSWYSLIVEMAKSIHYSKCNSCYHKKDCQKRCTKCTDREKCTAKCWTSEDYSNDEFLKIPQYVYNSHQSIYHQVLKECVKDTTVPSAPLSKAIFSINPSHIITTNYDRLLETSESEFRKQYDVIVTDKDLLDADKSKYIIKMHGDVLQPDTIVLKEQDYLEYSQKHVLIELFVKSLLADHTILFLGYSLNDYNVKLIVSWINYLRSQNKAFTKNRKVGYIVLDAERIDSNTKKYFRNNNIEVLNIHTLPQIRTIPPDLSAEKGKRLYSFLKLIDDPTLEEAVSFNIFMDKQVVFLSAHKIYDYSQLLDYLHISNNEYKKDEATVEFYHEEQYRKIISYLETSTDKAKRLEQMFFDVGVSRIKYSSNNTDLQYAIERSDALFDPFFSLYIQNKYKELLILCQTDATDILRSCFYKHLVNGYIGIEDDYAKVDFNKLSDDDKVTFLHNKASIDALKSFRFNSKTIENYINNIASSKERELYKGYLSIYEGNTSKRLAMITSLDKLRNNVQASSTTFFSGGSIAEIYKIKNYAIAQYLFYFYNHVFIMGFNDASRFFHPYIEAIIYANSDNIKNGNFMGFTTINEKYSVTVLDIDIISKFISSKELLALINSSKITQFQTGDDVIEHLVHCVSNLAESMILDTIFGFRGSLISILTNLLLLLTKLNMTDSQKATIVGNIQYIFSSDTFNHSFWNVGIGDFKTRIKVFALICRILPRKTNVSCLKSIISSPGFYEYVINTDFYANRDVILFFLQEDDYDGFKNDIFDIIDHEQDFQRKTILLRFFYKKIQEGTKKSEYQKLLSANFNKLNTQAIYEFVFDDWIVPSQSDISTLFYQVQKLYKERVIGAYSFPDPLETKLEQIYILFISGVIDDISALDEMSKEYTHLHFLLHPDTFDYRKVDFSDYMWANFAHYEKYMRFFIEHKEEIKPRIIEKIRKREADEIEKKILYGYLLQREDIWNIEC